MKVKATVLMLLVGFVFSASFLFARDMSDAPVNRVNKGVKVKLDANRPNLSEAQLIRSAKLRQMFKNQEEPPLVASDKTGATVDFVPGGGDIFDTWHVTFDMVDDFNSFDLVDLSGDGNDWMWNMVGTNDPANSAKAPEPAVGTGREELLQIKVGVAKESDAALPYRVANLILQVNVDEGDPDDALEVATKQGPKWHMDEFGSHTSGTAVWFCGDFNALNTGYNDSWLQYLDSNPIDLTGTTAPELSIYTAYSIEGPDWDGATVFAITATDADPTTWVELVPGGGYPTDYLYSWNLHYVGGDDADLDYGTPTAGNHGGFTGNDDEGGADNWQTVTFDLSAHVNTTVIIRFALASDNFYSPGARHGGSGFEDGGWWLDSVSVADGGANMVTDLTPSQHGVGFDPYGPWEFVDAFQGGDVGLWLASYNITNEIIGSFDDSLTVGFLASYDADNTAAPDGGFEVSDALLQIYTRLEVDAGATFVDLVSAGDSTLMNNGYALVGETYTPVVTIQNFGLSDMEIWTAFLEIENAFGDLVYVESIYFYLDTLLMYPAFRDTSFSSWMITDEGDYTVRAYFELFGGDDEPLNDEISIDFHAYTAAPTSQEVFDDSLAGVFARGYTYETTYGDTTLEIADYFGRGDNEAWWTSFSGSVTADSSHEVLISPVMNLSAGTGYALRYQQSFFAGGHAGWIFNIKGTNDGGANWTTFKSTNGASPSSARHGIFILDISAVADGQAAFQYALEFIFEDTLAEVSPYGYSVADDITIYAGADLSAPGAPTGLAVVGGDMTAEVSWNPVTSAGVMYYSVYNEVITPGCDFTEVDVDIVPDGFPSETTWDISDATTGALFSAGDVDGGTACLPAGNYIFTIYDAFGDGICCDYGYGSYTVTVDGAVVIEADSAAAGGWASKSDPFTVTGTSPTDPDTSAVDLVTELAETDARIDYLANGSTYTFFVSATDHNGNEGVMSSGMSVVPADMTAPTAIADLYAENDADTVYLDWTAPDESAVDWMTMYEIHYSMAPITDANFDAATDVPASAVPPVATEGTAQGTMVIMTAPAAGSEYFFAIKTTDEAGNVSMLSNVASTDHMAPDSVGNLALTGPATMTTSTDVLTLSWTAPGDDGAVGTASSYEVRIAYSMTTLDWESASPLAVVVTPAVAGTMESVDLDPASLPIFPLFPMAIALVAVDDNDNVSDVSNIAVWAPVLSIADSRGIPTEYGISQNYPNPFNPSTRIEFALPEQANVVLKIYNVLGREVKELVAGEYVAGYHTVVWNATDNASNNVPSGIYFYRINAGKFSKTTKLVLLK